MAKETATNQMAIIVTGGKQYPVQVGDIITIEKLDQTYQDGDKVVFDKVLLTDDGSTTAVGAPDLKATVEGIFIEEGKGKKVRVSRFRSKGGPGNTRVYGHRQPYAKVKISAIKA